MMQDNISIQEGVDETGGNGCDVCIEHEHRGLHPEDLPLRRNGQRLEGKEHGCSKLLEQLK